MLLLRKQRGVVSHKASLGIQKSLARCSAHSGESKDTPVIHRAGDFSWQVMFVSCIYLFLV